MQQMGRTMVIVTQHAVSDPFILYFSRLSLDALCSVMRTPNFAGICALRITSLIIHIPSTQLIL